MLNGTFTPAVLENERICSINEADDIRRYKNMSSNGKIQGDSE